MTKFISAILVSISFAVSAFAATEVAKDAALLVDPVDIEAISHALEFIIHASPNEIELIKHKGLVQAKQFSWAKTAKATAAIYLQF